ncbi:MAG: catalase [Candidatus Adiutrix sp.]|nr:catalase [Candidatus Adiutrix sp.]
MSEEEKKQVQELKQRDREVHTHEQAHVNAAGGLAGAPVYEYQVGPDGHRYAVGGHVEVQSTGSSNPEEALREAEAVKRAATAPAEPSGPDRAAAAQASAEISRIKSEKMANQSNGSPLGQKVAGAYAAVKLGAAFNAIRPVLARV